MQAPKEEFDPNTQTLRLRNADRHFYEFRNLCRKKPFPTISVDLQNSKSVLLTDLYEKYCRGDTGAAKTKANSSLFVYIGTGILVAAAGFALYGTPRTKS
eukprot:6196524-Pleurochrysis_carterae.AAC.1